MNDREFLSWIHQRLVHQHGENELFDYMYRLREIIAATPPGQNPRTKHNFSTLEEALKHGT